MYIDFPVHEVDGYDKDVADILASRKHYDATLLQVILLDLKREEEDLRRLQKTCELRGIPFNPDFPGLESLIQGIQRTLDDCFVLFRDQT